MKKNLHKILQFMISMGLMKNRKHNFFIKNGRRYKYNLPLLKLVSDI